MRRNSSSKSFARFLAGFAFLVLLTSNVWAQGIYATLTGVVSDPSQAVVTNVKVTLRNVQSGSLRDTVTNNDGYFTFASVPVGSYEMTLEAKGFETYKVSGIDLSGGEKRNVNATLKVGTTSTAVEITGAVKPGANTLEISVVNLWPNRLVGDNGLSGEHRRTHLEEFFSGPDYQFSSGLLGPVTIQAAQQ